MLPGDRPGSPLPPATRLWQPAELPARGTGLAEGTPGWGESWQEGNHGACSHLLAFTLPLSLPAPTAVPGGDPLRDRPGGCGSRGASGTLSWPARARSAGCVYSRSPLVCGIIGARGKKGGKNRQGLRETPPCGSVPLGSPFLPPHLLPRFLAFAQYFGRTEPTAYTFCSRASAKKVHE